MVVDEVVDQEIEEIVSKEVDEDKEVKRIPLMRKYF